MKTTVWIYAMNLLCAFMCVNAQVPEKSGISYLDVNHDGAFYSQADSTVILVHLDEDALRTKEIKRSQILKRLSSSAWIIRRDHSVSIQGRSVNYLWKINDQLLEQPASSRGMFIIKLNDKDAVLSNLNQHNIHVITGSDNHLVIETTLDVVKNIIAPMTAVSYIGIEELSARPESKVLDLNLAPNRITNVHRNYPTLNGAGFTLSLKEGGFQTGDIDIAGRTFQSSVSSEISNLHATDMATVAGGAGNSFVTGRGVAREVRLTDSNFSNLFADPDAAFVETKASVQNHSYGTTVENFYGALAESYDLSANRNPALVHVFSSGNAGNATPSAGVYQGVSGYANLTGNFKQAKNIITVGSVDTTGNVQARSSKGPAFDGRIKPELVAYSVTGTSTSAAMVSGVAILLQEAYMTMHGVLPPSALVKNILLNTAQDVGVSGPDFKTGFGNLDAFRAVKVIQSDQYITGTLSAGASQNHEIVIPTNAINLKVMLTWNDPAAPVNSGGVLVNDLDLALSSGSQTWLPWTLSAGASVNSLTTPAVRSVDRLNPVEQITVEGAAEGVYNVRVTGYAITSATQQYHLSWTWDVRHSFTWLYPTAIDNFPYNGEAGTYFYWKSTLSEKKGVLSYSLDDGVSWTLIDEVDLDKGYYRWTELPQGSYVAVARMQVSGGEDYLSEEFTVSTPLLITPGFNCGDSLMIQWRKLPEASSYLVSSLQNNLMTPYKVVSDTFLIIDKLTNPSAYYNVTPKISDRSAIASETINYNSLGGGCFFNSFFDEMTEEGIYLNLILGTTYGVSEIRFFRDHGNGFELISVSDVLTGTNIRVFDNDPRQGLNRYKAALLLENGEEVETDVLENFFVTRVSYLVFPNPVRQSQELRVFSKTMDNLEINFELFNQYGAKVLTTSFSSDREFIPVTGLPPGIYIYRLSGSSGLSTARLIITAE